MEISRILRLPKNVKGGHIWIHTTFLCINTENVWSNKSVRRLDRSIERPAKTFKGQPKLPSGDIATPWGLVNSPRLRPLLPTFNTKSSSIGLFREQALPIKDLEKKTIIDQLLGFSSGLCSSPSILHIWWCEVGNKIGTNQVKIT